MLTLSKIKRAFRRLVGIGQLFFYGLVSDTLSFQLFDVSKVSLCTLWKFRGQSLHWIRWVRIPSASRKWWRDAASAPVKGKDSKSCLYLSFSRSLKNHTTAGFFGWKLLLHKEKKEVMQEVGVSLKEALRLEMRLSMRKECPCHGCMGCAIYRISLEGWRGTTRTSYFCYAMYGGKRHLVTWIDFLEANHEVSIFCKDSIRWCLPDDPSNRKKKQPHKSLIGFGFSILWRMPGWLDCSPQRHPVQH